MKAVQDRLLDEANKRIIPLWWGRAFASYPVQSPMKLIQFGQIALMALLSLTPLAGMGAEENGGTGHRRANEAEN
jgi:hypothetical protein